MQTRLLEAYFRDKEMGLIWATQISPFNEFMRTGMNSVVGKHDVERVDLQGNRLRVSLVEFSCNSRAHYPTLDARKMLPENVFGVSNATYAVTVRARFNCEAVINGVLQTQTVVVPFCRMPIMVGSDWCWTQDEVPTFDRGGYFIINGKHRVMMAQEQRATNKIMCMDDKGPCVAVFCRHPIKGGVARFEMRMHERRLCVYKHHFLDNADQNFIPVYVYLVACGVPWQDAKRVTQDKLAEPLTEQDALKTLGLMIHANRSLHGDDLLRSSRRTLNLMLCHVEPSNVGAYAAHMAERYWLFREGKWAEDADGDCKNKRYETVNKLMTDMMFYFYDRYMFSVFDELKKNEVYPPDMLLRIVKFLRLKKDTISGSIVKWFASGKWCIAGSVAMRTDVVEMVVRDNYNAQLSQLLRTTNGSEGVKKSKSDSLRLIHSSYRGFTCCVFVQDGEKTGIAKELALFAKFSRKTDSSVVGAYLEVLARDPRYAGDGRVMLDGVLTPHRVNVELMRNKLVDIRRKNEIAYDVGISCKCDTLDIRCDEGRLVQTVLRFYNGHVPILQRELDPDAEWRQYSRTGDVETLDAEEIMTHCMVAYAVQDRMKSGITHVSMHPTAIFGPIAAQVPFANHNQAPRLTYYTSQARQIASLPYETRKTWSTLQYDLWYGQKPLTRSGITDVLFPAKDETSIKYDDSGGGVNAFVVIVCDQYNQEDSVAVNKSFIERGALALTSYHRYAVEVDPREEQFVIDPVSSTGQVLAFTDQFGVPRKGTVLNGNDAYLYKWTIKDKTDTSARLGESEHGVVDDSKVYYSKTDKKWHVIVSVRTTRFVDEGHKLAVRQGQKTLVGDVRQQMDMPYLARDGTPADILVNVHSFPSRMTSGYFLEMIMSMFALDDGELRTATPFETRHEILVKLKEVENGGDPNSEMFIDGTTGLPIQNQLFCGYIYMQRIKRFPESAAYARATGPVSVLTGQPLQFRRYNGGLRNGEMEKDCLVAHGAAGLVVDRMRTCADETLVNVCNGCGDLKPRKGKACRACGKTKDREVVTRRAFVLMMQEMSSLFIDVRFSPST